MHSRPGPHPHLQLNPRELCPLIDWLTVPASKGSGSPFRKSGKSLIDKHVYSGRIGTPAYPAAETIRPQLGSPPVIAVLTRLLSAMLLAIASACVRCSRP